MLFSIPIVSSVGHGLISNTLEAEYMECSCHGDLWRHVGKESWEEKEYHTRWRERERERENAEFEDLSSFVFYR